jgi:conjugative transfer signal peptidase TraF
LSLHINSRRRSAGSCLAASLVLGLLAVADVSGFRVNTTDSMPRGLWRVTELAASLSRGQIVTVCPPLVGAYRLGTQRGYVEAGSCPDGYAPIIKPVAATEGDLVTVSRAGVTVNGRPLLGTAPLDTDSAGRPLMPLAPGRYQVRRGDVWLLATYDPRSFDSRYFGPVPESSVLALARPVWVVR